MKKSRLIRVVSNKIFVVRWMLFMMPWEPRGHPNGLILWLNRLDDPRRCILYVVRHTSKEENTTGKVCIENNYFKVFHIKKQVALSQFDWGLIRYLMVSIIQISSHLFSIFHNSSYRRSREERWSTDVWADFGQKYRNSIISYVSRPTFFSRSSVTWVMKNWK